MANIYDVEGIDQFLPEPKKSLGSFLDDYATTAQEVSSPYVGMAGKYGFGDDPAKIQGLGSDVRHTVGSALGKFGIQDYLSQFGLQPSNPISNFIGNVGIMGSTAAQEIGDAIRGFRQAGIEGAINQPMEDVRANFRAMNIPYGTSVEDMVNMAVASSPSAYMANPPAEPTISRFNAPGPFNYGTAQAADTAANTGYNYGYSDPTVAVNEDRIMIPQSKPDFTLGDSDDAFDFQFKVDAPFGINPLTGRPYQTPRTIADQNRVLGRTFTEPKRGLAALVGNAFRTLSKLPTPGNLARGFLDAVTGPRRETTGIVYDDRGRAYTPEELNKMNAKGGYYSEPAREQRRREKRVQKMLERKAAGKSYSQKNLNKLTTGGSKPGTYTTPGSGNAGESRSKIVCTMMNERYGFGSFRNKIWMKFHESYGPEYQKGYHAIFLPLVKIAKGEGKINTAVRKVLEHMGRHVTADMFKIMKGKKRDPLGRIYRAIFEPTCRIIGKIKSALGRG